MTTELLVTYSDKYILSVDSTDSEGNTQISTANMYACEFNNEGQFSWNGDFPLTEPVITPTSELVQQLINVYGQSLTGKKIVVDLEDVNGNIVRLV